MDTTENAKKSIIRFGVGGNWFAHANEMTFDQLGKIIVDEAKAVAEDGFDDIELSIAHADPWIDQLPQSFWEDIGAQVREAGVEPISVHGPYYPRLEADYDDAVRKLVLHAKATAALGAHAMVVHPVNHPGLHVTTIMRKGMQWDVDISYAISDALGDSGTHLAIENVTTNSFRYLQELFSKLDRTNIGMCFDTGHYHCRPEHSLEQIIETFADRIVHVHLSDNDSLSDQHLPPGDGLFPWKRFFNALPPEKVGGHLMLELSAPMLLQDPDAMSKTRQMHRRALELAKTTIGAALAN